MSVVKGKLRDAAGNIYSPQSEAQDVKLSDNRDAQTAMTSISAQQSSLATLISNLSLSATSLTNAVNSYINQ